VTGTLTIIREAALEHKLRVSLLPLSNYRFGEQLISFSLDAIATTAVVEHNRGLIRPDHVLLILKTLVFMSKTLVKPLLPYLLRQPRLPR
jgi:ABC-type polysaccharide/polyol phosphate export permease